MARAVRRALTVLASSIWKSGLVVILALHLAVPVASAQVVPDQPQNLTAARDTSTTTFVRVVLTWDTPANTGDSPITDVCFRYRPYVDPSYTQPVCTPVANLGGMNKYTSPHLDAGTLYEFNIALENDAGRSTWAWVRFTAGFSPRLAATPTSVAEDAEATSVTVTVTLGDSVTLQRNVPVTVSVGGGTATAGTDYAAVEDFTVTVLAGRLSAAGTFTLTPTDDDVVESNETIEISATATGFVNIAGAEVTITDDDERGLKLSKKSVTVTEAAGTGRTATYTVRLTSEPTDDVTVAVQSDDTSVATVSPASLSFTTSNWKDEQTVTVTGVDDTVDNTPDRTTTISHSASGGDYASETGSLTVTVTDNETTSAFSIADASVAEGDSGTADLEFTVTLSPAADVTTTVDWATSDGSATAGTDYTAGSGTLTFTGGETSKTITVKVTGDVVDEGDSETLSVTLSNVGGGAALGTATATRSPSPTTTRRPRA